MELASPSGKGPSSNGHSMASPSSRVEERNKTEEDNFKRRLVNLRKAVVAAFVCHILATALVMSMGYSYGGVIAGTNPPERLYYSPSIVFFGFGCLTTCVFAGVEAWTMLEGTSSSAGFPDWMFHNNGFLSSAGNMFFLSLFLLPSLVVYMLHGHGEEFFEVLKAQKTENEKLFQLILAHIFLGFFVFMADGLTIMRQTAKLKLFSGNDDDEEEGKEAVEEESDDDDDDDERTQELQGKDKLLGMVTLVSHFLFEIDLAIIASRKANSGTTGSAIIFGAFLVVWIFFAWRSRNKQTTSESWLLNYRLATLAHFFAFLCLFWVALGILLFQETLGEGFFSTLGGLVGWKQFQCILLLLLFFIYLAIYFIILTVHSKNMWSIDEIMTIRKIAHDQGALIDAVRDRV